MTNREYLNSAERAIRNEYHSMDGWQGVDNSWSADDWQGAVGEATPIRIPEERIEQSSPFIIKIVNAASAAISNVDIGDSYENRAATNFNQNASITITSTVTGVSYREFLAESETHPFEVGKTLIISTSAGQLDEVISITHRNGRGKREDVPMSPTVDPNQNQTDRVIDSTRYLFDGYTRLRINQINGSATVWLRLYPISVFNPTKIIGQSSGNIKFSDPRLVKTAQVNLLNRGR